MKFINLFLSFALVLIVLAVMSPPAKAQTSEFTNNAGVTSESGVKWVDIQGTINSGDSLWTNPFTVGPYSKVVQLLKVMDQANDSAKIKVERWELKLPDTWALYKTLATSDSTQAVNQVQDTLKLQYQKLLIIGNSGTGLNATFKLRYELSPP